MVGGVDSLCLTTLYGFNSLELISTRTVPAVRRRRAAASRSARRRRFALLEPAGDDVAGRRDPAAGVGESSDAYHMSSPHPEGLGARIAMEKALAAAGLASADIDYINLHGTATPSNDAAEGKAVAALFGDAPRPAVRPRARPATRWARPAGWRR